ncbi:hypothetical protein ACSHUH_05845 [Bacillus subtilis]|uniref:hypothetical protein n=1 Tax=Bacillus subtilis group TaxID=653685 RepID=UPI0004E089D3|nr:MULTISPECIES: hypothetical protein [Bacillus subtilis group]AII38066.1 hypothetical protein M036_13535 [Bacillus subtilis TO-A]AKN14768.1 hypothetical protein ABU16_3692 [Bacillus subtilis]MBT9250376.1 hypothetical protein [Bacillus halotolerans]QAW34672.1 hypothetical protein ETK61_18555 [Bacillus subtilis]
MSEAVMDMYNALEEVGFSQNQIDEMDIVYHLKRLARRKETTENPKANENDQVYIDQILG